MCMHKIELVYTRVVLCVWPQNYLCMSTIASPPLQFCVYTIPILCVRSVKTARNVYAQNAICVRDVQFVYTRIIICVWPQTFFVYVHRLFCGQAQKFHEAARRRRARFTPNFVLLFPSRNACVHTGLPKSDSSACYIHSRRDSDPQLLLPHKGPECENERASDAPRHATLPYALYNIAQKAHPVTQGGPTVV